MPNFIQTKIKYLKTFENGKQKRVTEDYIFEAECFTDAEKKAYQYAQNEGFADSQITSVKNCRFTDIVLRNNECCEPLWYKVKLDVITLNEKSGKEQHTTWTLLIAGQCFQDAEEAVGNYMAQSVCDTRLLSIAQTKIADVIFNK